MAASGGRYRLARFETLLDDRQLLFGCPPPMTDIVPVSPDFAEGYGWRGSRLACAGTSSTIRSSVRLDFSSEGWAWVYRAALIALLVYLADDARILIVNAGIGIAICGAIWAFLPTYKRNGETGRLGSRFAVFYIVAVWIWNCFGLFGRRIW